MTAVAIYARYSSGQQRDASIEDQLRLCQERARAQGWSVAGCYTDHAVSGSSLLRPGIQQLMQDVLAGRFEIILSEALDRLSRDQEDIAGFFKRMRFAGVKIVTLSEGEVSDLHIGLKGTMNALYIKDLADKTRRGLRGRVEAGKSGGGNSYGYDVVKSFNADGEPVRGQRRINEEESAVVYRIFNEYASGKSPRGIARKLNTEGVPGPSSAAWGPSTINGNYQRGTGVLNNELYIGRLVWNRLRYIKDPDTGKRVSRLNPESEWVIHEVPELRIIDQDLWDRVKARQLGLRKERDTFWQKQRPRMLFSYLLKCGVCGSGFSKISTHHYGCTAARDKGTCTNLLTIRQDDLEETILNALQHRLMDPALVKIFCEEYTSHLNAVRARKSSEAVARQKKLARLARERDRLIQAIKDGLPASEVKEDLARIAEERTKLEAEQKQSTEEPVRIHPRMAEIYRKQVMNLREALNNEAQRTEAGDLIRRLIERIELTPDEDGGKELIVDLYGDLAGILSVAAKTVKPLDESEPSVVQVKMVAGAGFEPATFRL